MSEELLKLMSEKPDVHTLAWWEQRFQEVMKGYRGATHAINKALADNEDFSRSIADLRARLQAQADEINADRAKTGELQARVQRMAEFMGKLKPNGEK